MTRTEDFDTKYYGARVLVLGAAGFIGRWVARTLCARRAQVHLVDRDKATAEQIFSLYDVDGNFFECDLQNFVMIETLFRKIRPSITFNLAGYGVNRSERSEQTAYQINARLVEVICEAIAKHRDPKWQGQDIVHVGSAFEYGMPKGRLSEDSVPEPTTLYGKSKLAGTESLAHCCKTLAIKGLTARLFTIYGPGEHQGRLLPSVLNAAETGQPLQLTTGTQKRDFTYVGDVAEGLLRLGVSPAKPGEIIHLATGRLTSVRKFVEIAAKVLGIPYDRLLFGAIPTRVQEETEIFEVTLERLQQLTKWIPDTEIDEGIRKTWKFENRSDGSE